MSPAPRLSAPPAAVTGVVTGVVTEAEPAVAVPVLVVAPLDVESSVVFRRTLSTAADARSPTS